MNLIGRRSPEWAATSRGSSMRARLVCLALLVCTLWASVGIVIKITLSDAPPLGLGAVRMLLSGVVLWLWLAWRSPPKWNGIPWRLVGFATLFYLLLQAFTHAGFQNTSAARGILLLNTTPLFVAVLVHFIPPQERLNIFKTLGLVLAFMGVCTIFGRSLIDGAGIHPGDALMLLAAASWSVHTLATKRAAQWVDAGTLMLTQFLGAGIALAALSLGSESLGSWHATPRLAIGVLYLAIAGTVVSWLLWVHVLKNVPAGTASSFIFTVPLIGIVLSWLLLGEQLTFPFVVGAALVSLGITMVNLRIKQAAPPAQAIATRIK